MEKQSLKGVYGDGSVDKVAEQYRFRPSVAVGFRLAYTKFKIKDRSKGLSFHLGLGYKKVSFEITRPVLLTDMEKGTLVSEPGGTVNYTLGYIAIPVGLRKVYKSTINQNSFIVGGELVNNILTDRKAYVKSVGDTSDYRLASVADFWLGVSLSSAYMLQLQRNWFLSIEGRFGIVPMNLLRYDEFTFRKQVGNSHEYYERTKKINFFGGVSLSLIYLLE